MLILWCIVAGTGQSVTYSFFIHRNESGRVRAELDALKAELASLRATMSAQTQVHST